MKRIAVTLALVGASTLGLANTSHAMTLPTPSALKEAVPSNTSQVFWRGGGWGGGWRGGGWGPGIGFGIAAGALTAAAIASTPYWGGGYGGGYPGYGYAPAYGYGYGYAPASSYAYAPPYDYGYAPVSSYAYAPAYGYAPAYSYSYGTRYVSPRARYAYGGVALRLRYANTSAYGVRTYSSGPRYRAIGSRSTVRVVNRHR